MAERNIQDNPSLLAMQPLTVSTSCSGFEKSSLHPVNNFNVGSLGALQYLSWLQSSTYNRQITSNSSSHQEQAVTSWVYGNRDRNFCPPRSPVFDRQSVYNSINYSNFVSTFSTFLSRLTVNPCDSFPYTANASVPPEKMLLTPAVSHPLMEYSSFIYQKHIWQKAASDIQNLMSIERYTTSNSIYSLSNYQKALLHTANAMNATNAILNNEVVGPPIASPFIDTTAYTPPASPMKRKTYKSGEQSCKECKEVGNCPDGDTNHTENMPIPESGENLENTPRVNHNNQAEKSLYICEWESCGKKFSRYVNLLSHERTHQDGIRPYVCKIESCDKRYKYLHQLKQHEYTHVKEKPFICRWQFCKKSYKRLNHYMRHEQTHASELQPSAGFQSKENESMKELQNNSSFTPDNKDNFVCKEKSCGKSFKRMYHLQRHERTHVGNRNIVCTPTSCDKTYMWLDNFQNQRESYLKEESFICRWDSCDKKYTRREHLKRHERIHTGETFICQSPSCGKGFHRMDHLRVHQYTHTGKRFQCNLCMKHYKRQDHLRRHERIHTGVSFICKSPSCGKGFYRIDHYRNHQYTHSDKRFQCKLCVKHYKRPDHLKRHERIHTGDSFVCESPSCGKSFFRKDHFRKHQFSHSDEKLFKCKFCMKQFKILNKLRAHEKTTHKLYSTGQDNQTTTRSTRSTSSNNTIGQEDRYKLRSRSLPRTL